MGIPPVPQPLAQTPLVQLRLAQQPLVLH